MLKNSDTTIKADLRKKSSIMDEIEYSNYNIQACMVILVIMMVLLLSIISVVTAQNPNLVLVFSDYMLPNPWRRKSIRSKQVDPCKNLMLQR